MKVKLMLVNLLWPWCIFVKLLYRKATKRETREATIYKNLKNHFLNYSFLSQSYQTVIKTLFFTSYVKTFTQIFSFYQTVVLFYLIQYMDLGYDLHYLVQLVHRVIHKVLTIVKFYLCLIRYIYLLVLTSITSFAVNKFRFSWVYLNVFKMCI